MSRRAKRKRSDRPRKRGKKKPTSPPPLTKSPSHTQVLLEEGLIKEKTK